MIVVLTGPVGSGKTTALVRALGAGGVRARGVLQPVVDGRRVVLDAATGEWRPLEAASDASPTDVVRVGRFRFSADALSWANRLVQTGADAADAGEWVVVDEVGPLELSGGGLAQATHRLVASTVRRGGPHALIVVREALVDSASQSFNFGVRAIRSPPTSLAEVLAR